jgi:hypothetical protein
MPSLIHERIPQVQREVIQRLAILLEANPSNKRALCQMQVIAFLLRLCPRFNEAILGNYLELVHTLGSYDITAQEVRLLFELALLRFDRVDFALFASFFSLFSNPSYLALQVVGFRCQTEINGSCKSSPS